MHKYDTLYQQDADMPRVRPLQETMPRIVTKTARRERHCFDVSSPEARRVAEMAAADRAIEQYDRRVVEMERATQRATVYATTAVIAGATALLGFCILAATAYAGPAVVTIVTVAMSIGFGVTWVCRPYIS